MQRCWLFGLGMVLCAVNGLRASDPLSPRDAQSSFVLHPDCRIELVASEPDVIDPVHIAFAPDGKLWVVEYSDYPNGPGEGEPGKSRIRVLSDADGDGRYSDPVMFAEGLIFANGLMHWKDGVFVTTNGQVLFMRDTDGDGRCDETQQWFTGFATENPQLRCNHPTLGPDNKIYIANGLRGGSIMPGADYPWPNKRLPEPLNISGRDFRFDPQSGEYEAISGNGQFGLTFDDWGNRFVCSNRNPCNHIVLEEEHLKRAPYMRVSKVFEEVSPAGEKSKLYPISRTWTTSNLHANQFTAACGVTIYRGNALPDSFYGNSFTCEPTGNLVHRDILTPSGITFTSKPGRDGVEFLATKDEWFRPVNLAHGPDGALYVVDMYRAVIEHPQFVPEELKNRPDQLLGMDRGRIWRVVSRESRAESPEATANSQGPKAQTRTEDRGSRADSRQPMADGPRLADAGSSELVALLAHPNAWQRETARRLLVERRDAEVAADLRELLANREEGIGRIEALRTLQGIGALTADDLAPVDDAYVSGEFRLSELDELLLFEKLKLGQHMEAEPSPRERLVRWLQGGVQGPLRSHPRHSLMQQPQLKSALLSLTTWSEFAMVATAPELSSWMAMTPFLRQSHGHDAAPPWTLELIQVHAGGNLVEAWGQMFERGSNRELRDQLVTAIARKNDAKEVEQALQKLLEIDGEAALIKLIDGLPGGRNKLLQHLSKLPDESQQRFYGLVQRITASRNWNSVRSPIILGLVDDADSLEKLRTNSYRGSEALPAVLEALAMRPEPQSGSILAESLPQLPPAYRNQAITALATTPDRIHLLLDLVENGQLPALAIDPNIAKRLMGHADPVIKEKAVRLLKQAPPEDRVKVLAEYAACLTLSSDPRRGKQVFVKNCATCHKVGDVGVDVAPDISDSRTKTLEYLLTNILDPNRAIDNNFFSYTVVDTNGVTYTGILVSETGTSITLKQPEGKVVSLGRDEIEAMKNNGVSLMPVGLEKTIPPQDMADVISYIKNWRYLDGSVPEEVIGGSRSKD
ncbi:MAG: c-type cytochrome [Planctomycetaceae bacterium]|nr:c-type cytochrome [Planctomycetaceae bacterium]